MLVMATLFVCGGGYTHADVATWCRMMRGQPTAIIVVGNCNPLTAVPDAERPTVFRELNSRRAVGTGHARYGHLHNKFMLWKLPFDKIAYYDLDVVVKPPVNRCADMCTSPMCAVRDPVATWPRKVKTYFNSGVLIITPNRAEYNALRGKSPSGKTFPDQDVLNEHFANRWQKLPKECNWLNHEENRPSALTDTDVWAVHVGRKWR